MFLIVIASVAIIAVVTLFSFRLIVRKLGVKELIEEGVLLTENGIEFPRFIFAGKCSVEYGDIESVELLHFPQTLLARVRYGPSVSSAPSARWDFLGDTVMVKLKAPSFIQYYLFTPHDPAGFASKLKSQIDGMREGLKP